MFGIGYQEMFVILVVALVVFGPARLPELAGQVGRWVRDFRRMSSDLTGEFEKTFAEVDEVKKSFQREIQGIQDEVEGVGKSARGDLRKGAAKSGAGAKKLGAGAQKSGAAASGRAATGKASGTAAKAVATTGDRRARARGGKLADLPVASREDPLADVSFFDLDLTLVSANGAGKSNGVAKGSDEEALSRVRRRRAAAAYAQHQAT
jgi:sec-independent protein translocase protein TatB